MRHANLIGSAENRKNPVITVFEEKEIKISSFLFCGNLRESAQYFFLPSDVHV
jgi:hypothetical protein